MLNFVSMITEGTTLSGRNGNYQVERKIAEGGMGYVYEGRTNSSDVVIKIPKLEGKDSSKDKMHLEKLEVETKILRKLAPDGNKHIVRYIDDGLHEDLPFLVIEKLEQKTMNEVCKGKPLDQEHSIHYTKILLETLSYLHSKNILHRDVNPKNLIIDQERDIVLIDFGAAKDGYNQISESETVTLIGTSKYSAPEQFFENEVQSAASDVYSAGAVMLFMLMGEDPHMDHRHGGLAVTKEMVMDKGIDKRLADIILRAMNFDPAKRFQTPRSMLKAINGEPDASAKPPFIALADSEYELRDSLSIGRVHTCDEKCLAKGYKPPDVSIDDPNMYVSKHHLQIYKDGNDFFLEDLGSLNYTAIFREGWRIIDKNAKVMLRDKDSVALAYDADKDLPYITFRFIGWS